MEKLWKSWRSFCVLFGCTNPCNICEVFDYVCLFIFNKFNFVVINQVYKDNIKLGFHCHMYVNPPHA